MSLYDRFELLELRRDDGIQTFHAREIATARPVQIHLMARGRSPENEALLSRLDHLPDAERRRIVDRGETEGLPYVVTDRLAGHPGFREWLTVKSDPATRISSLDQQFRDLFETAETAEVNAPRPRMGRAPEPAIFAGPAAFLPSSISQETFSPPGRNEQEIPTGQSGAETGSHAKSGRKSNALLGIVFGILAAIGLLALIIAAMAFRPR